jgi:hypothetical protein
MERNHTMMQFKESGAYQVATNSIKHVAIHKSFKGYMVYTPEGRLLDSFESAGPFVDFESAKRNAEMNVGMKMNWEDF